MRVYVNRDDYINDYAVLVVLLPMIIPLFLLGIIIIKKSMSNKRACEKLRLNGNYIITEIVDVWRNKITGLNISYIQCKYISNHGSIHFFKTEVFGRKSPESLMGRKIKVYCSEDMSNYYIDDKQFE